MRKRLNVMPLILLSVAGIAQSADFSPGVQGGSYGTVYITRPADSWALP